jgi:hypothetical protein
MSREETKSASAQIDARIAARIEDLEESAQRFLPAVETLAGDWHREFMRLLREMPQPFHTMSEYNQRTYVAANLDWARTIVRRGLGLIASEAQELVGVKLVKMSIDEKGVDMKLSSGVPPGALRHALSDAIGSRVFLLLNVDGKYFGQGAPAYVDLQEPSLPLGDPPATRVEAEQKVEADLDRIIAADDQSEPQLALSERERYAKASANPYEAGRQDALLGFNETRNPFTPNTERWEQYLAGHAVGLKEREEAMAVSGKRHRGRPAKGSAEDGQPAQT